MRSLLVATGLLILMFILFNLFVSFGQVIGTTNIISLLSNYVDQNRSLFIVWHILLYSAIFLALYAYIKHMITKHKFSFDAKKDAMMFCYLGTGIVIFIDLIYLIGRLL